MIFLLLIVIIVGIVGAVAFLNMNKNASKTVEDEVDEYDIKEIH